MLLSKIKVKKRKEKLNYQQIKHYFNEPLPNATMLVQGKIKDSSHAFFKISN